MRPPVQCQYQSRVNEACREESPGSCPGPESALSLQRSTGESPVITVALGAGQWSSPLLSLIDFRSATTKRTALRWFTVAVHRTFAVRLCLTQCRVSVHSFMWFTLCQLTWLYVLIWTTHHGCTGTRTYCSTGSETYAPTFCMFFSHVRIKWKLHFCLEGNFDQIYLSNKVVHSSYQTIKADQERESVCCEHGWWVRLASCDSCPRTPVAVCRFVSPWNRIPK